MLKDGVFALWSGEPPTKGNQIKEFKMVQAGTRMYQAQVQIVDEKGETTTWIVEPLCSGVQKDLLEELARDSLRLRKEYNPETEYVPGTFVVLELEVQKIHKLDL